MKVLIQGMGQDGLILAELLCNEGILVVPIRRGETYDRHQFATITEAYYLAGPSSDAESRDLGPALTAVSEFLRASREAKRRLVIVSPYGYCNALRSPYALYHRTLLDILAEEMDQSAVPLTAAVCYNHDSELSKPTKFLQKVVNHAAQEMFDATYTTMEYSGSIQSERCYADAYEIVPAFRAAILLGGTHYFYGNETYTCEDVITIASKVAKRQLRVCFEANAKATALIPGSHMQSLVATRVSLEKLLERMIKHKLQKLRDENNTSA